MIRFCQFYKERQTTEGQRDARTAGQTEERPFNPDYGESDKPVLMTGVECTGAEDSLAQCGENLEFVDDEFGNMTCDNTVVVCSGQLVGRKTIYFESAIVSL